MFGNHLCELVSDDIQIPTVVVKLITEIENKGEKEYIRNFYPRFGKSCFIIICYKYDN